MHAYISFNLLKYTTSEIVFWSVFWSSLAYVSLHRWSGHLFFEFCSVLNVRNRELKRHRRKAGNLKSV